MQSKKSTHQKLSPTQKLESKKISVTCLHEIAVILVQNLEAEFKTKGATQNSTRGAYYECEKNLNEILADLSKIKINQKNPDLGLLRTEIISTINTLKRYIDKNITSLSQQFCMLPQR